MSPLRTQSRQSSPSSPGRYNPLSPPNTQEVHHSPSTTRRSNRLPNLPKRNDATEFPPGFPTALYNPKQQRETRSRTSRTFQHAEPKNYVPANPKSQRGIKLSSKECPPDSLLPRLSPVGTKRRVEDSAGGPGVNPASPKRRRQEGQAILLHSGSPKRKTQEGQAILPHPASPKRRRPEGQAVSPHPPHNRAQEFHSAGSTRINREREKAQIEEQRRRQKQRARRATRPLNVAFYSDCERLSTDSDLDDVRLPTLSPKRKAEDPNIETEEHRLDSRKKRRVFRPISKASTLGGSDYAVSPAGTIRTSPDSQHSATNRFPTTSPLSVDEDKENQNKPFGRLLASPLRGSDSVKLDYHPVLYYQERNENEKRIAAALDQLSFRIAEFERRVNGNLSALVEVHTVYRNDFLRFQNMFQFRGEQPRNAYRHSSSFPRIIQFFLFFLVCCTSFGSFFF